MLTPSQRQLRHREVGWEGSPRQDLCTEEHELHMRQAEVGELANDSEARHRQRPRCVDAAAVEGHNLLLSGEACPGVVGNGDDGHRKVVADRAGVSRGHSTGGGSAVRREGPNVIPSVAPTSVLDLVTMTVANPRQWAWWGSRR